MFLCGQTINDTSPEVREASFEALGTAMKVIGEKVITALMGDVDPIKMTKVSITASNTRGEGGGSALLLVMVFIVFRYFVINRA